MCCDEASTCMYHILWATFEMHPCIRCTALWFFSCFPLWQKQFEPRISPRNTPHVSTRAKHSLRRKRMKKLSGKKKTTLEFCNLRLVENDHSSCTWHAFESIVSPISSTTPYYCFTDCFTSLSLWIRNCSCYIFVSILLDWLCFVAPLCPLFLSEFIVLCLVYHCTFRMYLSFFFVSVLTLFSLSWNSLCTWLACLFHSNPFLSNISLRFDLNFAWNLTRKRRTRSRGIDD